MKSKSLVRTHRHVSQYLNDVKIPFEGFAEEHDLKNNILWVVNKVYGFTNRSEAIKFSYDLAVSLGGFNHSR